MNYTSNYQLNQWDAEDKVQRTDFNADNAKIDAALKAQADALAGKASATEVSRISSDLLSVSAAVGRRGNCRVLHTTYKGSGQCGADHPNSLSFSQKPRLVVIFSSEAYMVMGYGASRAFGLSMAGSYAACSLTWDTNSVSWYSSDVRSQMNQGSYSVIALSEM